MDDGAIAPLLFLDFVEALSCNLKQHISNSADLEKKSLVFVLKTCLFQLVNLQPFMLFSLLIIQKQKSIWLLKYDSRFAMYGNISYPVKIWILDEHGQVLNMFNDIALCPPIHNNNNRNFKNTTLLSNLLSLGKKEPDPKNYSETIDFLKRHNKDTSVTILHHFSSGKQSFTQFWNKACSTTLVVDVFTTSSLKLGFRINTQKTQTKPLFSNLQTNDEIILSDSVTQANRSSAVSVKLTGLNLAFNLACCSESELKVFSLELGKCAVFMWMEYDNQFNARYVTLYSRNQFFQIEIKNTNDWKKVFDYINKEKIFLRQQKQKILSSLLFRLEKINNEVPTLFKTCLTQLKTCIFHLKIIVFSTDDTALHALKLYFAHYLELQLGKKFRGIGLNANAKNDLIMLTAPELTFLNLNMYLKEDVLPKNVLCTPIISSNIKNLKKQPQQENMTCLFLCKQRGKQIAPALLNTWLTIGSFFMTHFTFDIFSMYFVSLSLLSYQTIWTKYSRKAGIFHHALEKTKIAYEKIFRSFSNGGYSYSCQDTLNCGEPLHKQGQLASTILELDINSSYGFAGSNIQTPKGFCNAFIDTNHNMLKLCEPVARHQTFEFLSVYYTLWLLQQKKILIQTVYSNFHQNGLFRVGKYPLDLTVIVQNGDIYMYQFDGDYIHGCRQGCDSLYSYVNNKTRQEVEQASAKRDEIILSWCKNMSNVYYYVITNCHDVDYSMKSLKQSFDNNVTLNQLVNGYPTSKIITKDDVLFSSNELTFIIVLSGYVPHLPNRNEPLKALVLRNKTSNWTRNTFTEKEPILLTKDYLQWLIKKFNFQVTKIHQVFFYKKCDILNTLFQELVNLRMSIDILPSTKQLLKNVINFACGYFGLNNQKLKPSKLKLVTKIGKRFDVTKQNLLIESSIENVDFYIKQNVQKTKSISKMPFSPVPIFVMIIEFGKLRMSQILCFFDKYFVPSQYQHLYSNIDNVVIALSTPTVDEAVNPLYFLQYQNEKQNMFQPTMPGHLKLEWVLFQNQRWKFISPKIMNYAVVASDSNYSTHKNSAINNQTAEQAYATALDLFNKKTVKINQTRRVNKLLNKDVKITTFVYNK